MKRAALAALVLGLAAPAGAAAFAPTDPLAARQWYLAEDHAFDAWPDLPATLAPVRVAVIDSGIDGTHPEFAGKIVAAKSFVGGSPLTDEQGHGTFVAGEIAAGLDNAQGIAGIAFNAQLLVAKVVQPDATISLQAEAQAIHWAVDNGARVVNLSIGGLRDPLHPGDDTFSPLEAGAVAYAVRQGALVVAAVGNSDRAPSVPWPFASYPAALPHVLGVSALARDGSVPLFSDRDAVFNDIAAPGDDLLSTFPAPLTAVRPACVDQGYSDCGPDDYRPAQGTSFAAPQVTAAAALLLGADPQLTSDQVSTILERTADDANATNGCLRCPLGRDALSGWGRLDVAKAIAALQGPLPDPDSHEPDDGLGAQAATVYGPSATINATIDYWDDPIDVYRVRLAKGMALAASLTSPPATSVRLQLWKPEAKTVVGISARVLSKRAAVADQHGALSYRAPAGGWYALEVSTLGRGSGPYMLSFVKR